MGLFRKLAKATIHTLTAPVAIVKDIGTLGGLNTDQRDPYTVQKLRQIRRDVKEVSREVDDL